MNQKIDCHNNHQDQNQYWCKLLSLDFLRYFLLLSISKLFFRCCMRRVLLDEFGTAAQGGDGILTDAGSSADDSGISSGGIDGLIRSNLNTTRAIKINASAAIPRLQRGANPRPILCDLLSST